MEVGMYIGESKFKFERLREKQRLHLNYCTVDVDDIGWGDPQDSIKEKQG
jgi:hypothetical protein